MYVYILYALLAALSLHVAWLTWMQPRLIPHPRLRALAYLALTAAFLSLAEGRSGILGGAHGQNATLTRGAFAAYGAILFYVVICHWRQAWRHRRI